jgi:hypothetical protein
MKIAIRSILFHIICIIMFAIIYFLFKNEFEYLNSKNNYRMNFLDFLFLSTTIQSGVGISGIAPTSSSTKILMIIQQIIMLSTYIFTIYFFTL